VSTGGVTGARASSGAAEPGHVHGLGSTGDGSRRRLTIVLGLALAFSVAELFGGWLTGSLALLADAFHLISDVAALAISVFAAWMIGRPSSEQRTFGHSRAEILAALANGVGLGVIACVIVWSAIGRFGQPADVHGLGVVAFGLGALVYEGISLALLHGGAQHNLNVRGAFLHILSDALGSLGAIASGLAIWAFGWTWADPAASLLISVLILNAAWRLVREAVDVLMEAAPGHVDVVEIRDAMSRLPAVSSVHDLHVWTVGSGEVCLSTHVVVPASDEGPGVLRAVRRLLRERFAISHTTIQIESPEADEDELAAVACEGACED